MTYFQFPRSELSHAQEASDTSGPNCADKGSSRAGTCVEYEQLWIMNMHMKHGNMGYFITIVSLNQHTGQIRIRTQGPLDARSTRAHAHKYTHAGEKSCYDLNSNLLLISSTVKQFSRNQEPCCATDREQVEAITTSWL